MRKGYQWPASAITDKDMAILDEVRALTEKPITVLIHEAIQFTNKKRWKT